MDQLETKYDYLYKMASMGELTLADTQQTLAYIDQDEFLTKRWYKLFQVIMKRCGLDVVNLFITRGILEASAEVREFYTHPIHSAALNNRTDMIQLMLDRGFKLEDEIWAMSFSDGMSSRMFKANTLVVACKQSNHETIEFILNQPVFTKPQLNFQIKEVGVQSHDYLGASALMQLALNSSITTHVEFFQRMVEAGADPTLKDARGMTALDWFKNNSGLSNKQLKKLKKIVDDFKESAVNQIEAPKASKRKSKKKKNNAAPIAQEDIKQEEVRVENILEDNRAEPVVEAVEALIVEEEPEASWEINEEKKMVEIREEDEVKVSLRQLGLECAVCIETFVEPMLTKCGHTFCKNCIKQCIREHGTCPECRTKLTHNNLSPNLMAKSQVDFIKRQFK